MLAAIIASLALSLMLIVDKINLSIKKTDIKTYLPISFVLLFIFTGLFVPKYGSVDVTSIFQLKYVLFFVGMIVSALIWNLYLYRSIQKEQVQEFEIVQVFSPLAIIFLAALIFPAEREWKNIIISLIAILVLMAAHLKPHHFKLESYTKWHGIEILFLALEAIFIRELLYVFSPFMLFFVRTGVLAIIMLFIYKPQFSEFLKNYRWLFSIMSVILGTVYMVSRFYGFDEVGVVETTLFLILSPILVYLLDVLILKERLKRRYLIAAAAIIALLVITQIL